MTTAPRETPFLVGHETSEAVFRRGLESGRLPHGWLLRGDEGVGKATLAYRLARLLLAAVPDRERCHEPTHALFRSVAHGSHPDLHVLERRVNPRTRRLQAEILVDAVREVVANLHATAARHGRRVLVVDAVDDLNRNAANALLKLLEEPPDGVVLLLVCQRPGAIPRTIISRCAQLRLRALEAGEVEEVLARLGLDLDEAARHKLAAFAKGSPGRAVHLHETRFLERHAALLERLAGAAPPVARAREAAELLEEVRAGHGIDAAFRHLQELARRAALARSGAAEPVLEAEAEAMARLGEGRALDHWTGMWEKLSRLPSRVETLNLDPGQALLLATHALIEGSPADLDG